MITLWTAATGNGHRVSIMLEEVGLPYTVRPIDFASGEQRDAALAAVNPAGQIPAIEDNDGPGGKPVTLAESAAILRYLGRKTGQLMPEGAVEELEADRWTAITGALSAAGTTVFFARMMDAESHAGIIARQFDMIGRHLAMMEARLSTAPWLIGDRYSYVDILGFTFVNGTTRAIGVPIDEYPAIIAWRDRIAQRPAVTRGLGVPG